MISKTNLKITKYIFKEMMNIKSISRMRLTKIKTTSISQQLNSTDSIMAGVSHEFRELTPNS